MDPRTEYLRFDGSQPRRRDQCFGALIEMLLRSRATAGLETGIHRPDEDVNVYLTDLLCRYVDAAHLESPGAEYVVPYETELHERLAESGETRAKYMAYRFNADHILVTLGVFGNGWWRSPSQSAFAWAPTREESIYRGKTYYGRAATYATRLEEGRKGLDDLLTKLEVGFEEYLRILEILRVDYFRLRKGFSSGEWFHLCAELGISPETVSPPGAAE